MSSTYEDQGPIPWYRTEQCIFYIVFFVVFPFFFVNIFVALIIVTFNELGEAELEDDMDKNQKSCIDFAIQAKPLELYVPSETSGIRYVWSWLYHELFQVSWKSNIYFHSAVISGKTDKRKYDHLSKCETRELDFNWNAFNTFLQGGSYQSQLQLLKISERYFILLLTWNILFLSKV